MKPATRLDLLGRRCASLAVTSSRVSARSLYIGFRALVQMNGDSALSRRRNNHQQQQQRSQSSDSHSSNRFPSAIFDELSTTLVHSARSIPARNIAPCIFAVSHGLQPQSRVRQQDWDTLQARLVSEMRTAQMNVDDTVSLLHSLSLHGRISSPALRNALFKRLAQVLCEVTRGQMLSVIYSISALGLGVADTGVDDGASSSAAAASGATPQFVEELQRQLTERAPTFSLGEITRLLSKVSVAVPLSARHKKDFCSPFLPQVSEFLSSSSSSHSSNSKNSSPRRDDGRYDSGRSTLSECPVLLLALARVRLFRHEAFRVALDHVVGAPASSLTPRQKVLVLFAIHTAGVEEVMMSSASTTTAAGLREWFIETASSLVRSQQEIDAELASNRWDNVTLSYYSVSVSCAADLLSKESGAAAAAGEGSERYKRIVEMRDFAAAKLASSSTRKGAAAPASPTRGVSNQQQQQQQQPEGSNDHQTKSSVAVSALMAAIKVRQLDSSSRSDVAASDAALSAALEQHMSSHERITAFITFAQRVVFGNTGIKLGASTTSIIDQQVQLIMRHVRFSTVPTNTIVAYLRVLGRLRLSGSTAPYEAALSILLGEVVGTTQQQGQRRVTVSSESSFPTYIARQQPPRHPSDVPEQEESAAGKPRTLLPAEAAAVLVVMGRASVRLPQHILRLCFIVARRVEDVSLSLRLAALHSIGELRCPDRHFTDVIVQSIVMSSEGDGSSSSSSSSSSPLPVSGMTRSDAALALIGCGFSYNVEATQSLSRVALAYFEKAHSSSSGRGGGGGGAASGRKELISRSRQIQLPVALAQVGAYSVAPTTAGSFIDRLALDAAAALTQANLPESWYTVLFWRHSISPLLLPETQQQCDAALRNFVRAKMEPVLNQQQHQRKSGGLSVLYQLACGLEFLWPAKDGSTTTGGGGNVLKESPSRLLWLPLASRLRGVPDLSHHPELVLPAGLCLVRILRAAATPSNDDADANSSKTMLSPAALRSLALELHASLESNVRLVTRSDDLALLLLSLRKLGFDAAEALMIENEQQQQQQQEGTKSSHIEEDADSLKKWIEEVCCAQIIVPLMKTIATMLYIRETAPPVVSSKNNASMIAFSSYSSTATMAATLTPPTSQLSCVGLRVLCEALSEGVLFDGEAETFEISANVISLAAQRLEPCLSVWDAAGSLRSLMAMATAPVVAHTPVTFTTMDTLATVVRAKSSASGGEGVLEHHRALCTSVLPGIGAIAPGSLLSL